MRITIAEENDSLQGAPMTLNDGKINGKYEVVSIQVDNKTKKRLQDMGITQGGIIKIMSFVGTHAFILRVRGSRVALGKDIVQCIEVNEVNNSSQSTEEDQ